MDLDWLSTSARLFEWVIGLAAVAGVAVAVLRWQIRAILMRPNGGNSVADVSSKVDELARGFASIGERVIRLEHQVDTILIPRQADIAGALELPRNSGDPIRVLVIEDDSGWRKLLTMSLRSIPSVVAVRQAASLEQAAEFVADVILLDLGLPDSHGTQSVLKCVEMFPGLPIVVLSGNPDAAAEALDYGAEWFVDKGSFTFDALEAAIDRIAR